MWHYQCHTITDSGNSSAVMHMKSVQCKNVTWQPRCLVLYSYGCKAAATFNMLTHPAHTYKCHTFHVTWSHGNFIIITLQVVFIYIDPNYSQHVTAALLAVYLDPLTCSCTLQSQLICYWLLNGEEFMQVSDGCSQPTLRVVLLFSPLSGRVFVCSLNCGPMPVCMAKALGNVRVQVIYTPCLVWHAVCRVQWSSISYTYIWVYIIYI